MRKKEKKVTYRQSVNFKLLSERQLENIFPGWNDLLDRIDSYRKWLGKKQIKREECINKQYNLMYENVYTILGGRGSGKTSAIFTLREYLEEDSVNNIVLPIVMPEVIPEHGETLGWILASLEELVKKLSDALEVQEKNRDNFFHECKRQKVSLADLYDEVKELCYSRQTKDGGTSFSEEIKINERRNQSGYELSKKMAEFWMQLVEAVKIVKHRKEKDDQKEPLIYLIFDDVDLNPEKALEICSTIIKYLSHPNLIIFMTADEELFYDVILNSMTHKMKGVLKYMDSDDPVNYNLFENSFERVPKVGKYNDKIQETASLYMRKIMPVSSRYPLKTFEDCAQKRMFCLDGEDTSGKADQSLEEFLKEIIDKFIIEVSDNVENKEKNFLYYNDGDDNNFISIYLMFLGTTSRQITDGSLVIQQFLKKLSAMGKTDAFYRDLAFGTGGLRGVIGAGTNRMNIYTVAKASQGLADYLKKHFKEPSVAIGYDSRIKSDVFAKVAAGVFAVNGVSVNIWPVLMPVPTVSFATRYLHTSAGVMVTASHNPGKYNGYKVYGADGCQITTEAAAEILAEIEKLDIFADVKTSNFEAGVANGSIRYIPDKVYTAFVEQVKSQSVLFGENVNKNVAIVYSPLNGTGLKPVTRTLQEMGYTNITVVKEQEQPDGHFPTCPYPNPEIKEAMALGMEYARKCNADLLLATDPDCDRVGIAVKNKAGEYELLTGNQTGMLLLDYICSQRIKHGKMPADPVMIKTIVTMDMGEQIAAHYGLRTVNVLTGFKFIGEQIGKLEQLGKADSYVFGFEESYGYLTGSYVRDKDGVDGAYMICEMFSYYATQGISLLDKLDELYKTYGYCLNTLHSYEFDGSAGFARMQSIMQAFRGGIKEFGGKKVVRLLDYVQGLDGLPKSDVLKFLLEDNCSLVVRPSGTEPKLKIYISVSAENKEMAEEVEDEIAKTAEKWIC